MHRPEHLAIVRRVAGQFPHLIATNTFDSCGEFVQRLVAALDAEAPAEEWGHVAKGSAEHGFAPKGSTQRVSHDCVFSRALNLQYKVTAYSAANSDTTGTVAPGPAQPMWTLIDPTHYRPNNPWVAPIPAGGSASDPSPVPRPIPAPGTPVTFRTSNNLFLCAEEGGTKPLLAKGSKLRSWANFTVVRIVGRRIALKAVNGKYLTAENGGGGELTTTRDAANAWEQFRIIPAANGGIALRVDDGRYVSVKPDGRVVADGKGISEAETFYPSVDLRTV